MSQIQYDGTPASAEKIRAAVAAIKARQTIHVRQVAGGIELDQEWPDGQVSRNRWTLTVGQSLDSETCAVTDVDSVDWH